MIPVFVLITLRNQFTASLVIFVSIALTDAVDGYLARKLNQRSRLGAILDPAADKLLMVSGYLVYTLHASATYRLPSWLTFTVFIRDLLIAVFAYLLYTRVHISRFPPSVVGKISTVLQVVTLSFAIAANTPLRFMTAPLLRPLFWATIGLTLYSGFDYMRRADRRLHSLRAELV
jgi:cardiolipin synthase